MHKLKDFFFVTSLLGIVILTGLGIYFYQIRQNYNDFESNFQQTINEFDQQAINSKRLINLKMDDVYLKGDYEKIELLIKNYLQRSLDVENSYRQQKNNVKINDLFNIDQLEQDKSLSEAHLTLERAELLILKMFEVKSEMFEQLIIDANRIELSTHKKTAQFHQNFRIFFSQYVKSQEQILALEKQNLAAKRNMLNFLEKSEWTIKNHQLIFADSNDLQQFQYLENEIKRTHLEKVSMQGKSLRSFLTIY